MTDYLKLKNVLDERFLRLNLPAIKNQFFTVFDFLPTPKAQLTALRFLTTLLPNQFNKYLNVELSTLEAFLQAMGCTGELNDQEIEYRKNAMLKLDSINSPARPADPPEDPPIINPVHRWFQRVKLLSPGQVNSHIQLIATAPKTKIIAAVQFDDTDWDYFAEAFGFTKGSIDAQDYHIYRVVVLKRLALLSITPAQEKNQHIRLALVEAGKDRYMILKWLATMGPSQFKAQVTGSDDAWELDVSSFFSTVRAAEAASAGATTGGGNPTPTVNTRP